MVAKGYAVGDYSLRYDGSQSFRRVGFQAWERKTHALFQGGLSLDFKGQVFYAEENPPPP